MARKTVELDEEAYEILSRKKQAGQSFSEVIKEHFGKPRYGTAGDLLRMADRYVLSEETLDAIEEQVQARSENPVRAAKLCRRYLCHRLPAGDAKEAAGARIRLSRLHDQR